MTTEMPTSTKTSDELCKICTFTREDHNSPNIHHAFSTDGQLRQKPTPKPVAIPPGAAMTVRLTSLLRDRGLISEEDFQWVLSGDPDVSPGRRAQRDSGSGPTSETQGDLRGALAKPLEGPLGSGDREHLFDTPRLF